MVALGRVCNNINPNHGPWGDIPVASDRGGKKAEEQPHATTASAESRERGVRCRPQTADVRFPLNYALCAICMAICFRFLNIVY